MTERTDNGIVRKLAAFSGITIAIAITIFALTFCGMDQTGEPEAFVDPQRLDENEADIVVENEVTDDVIKRYIVRRHDVVEGESISLIAGRHWDDIYLWPDLYLLNRLDSGDPDLIYPDEIVDIYNRLGRGNEFHENEKEMILNAYIEVYDIYKALGPHKNSSAWTLLWCGTRYDKSFLDLFAHRIASNDMAMARKYIAEEGFLD